MTYLPRVRRLTDTGEQFQVPPGLPGKSERQFDPAWLFLPVAVAAVYGFLRLVWQAYEALTQ